MGRNGLKTTLRLLVLLIVVPVVIGGSLWALNRNGFFNLDHIEIILTKNTDQPRFMRPLLADLDRQLEKLRGESLWTVDLEKMNAQIMSLPWVNELQVRRNWPDRLEVRIIPKEVKFLFVGKAGQLFPVLEDGTFLNPVSVDSMPDVVLLRGDEFVQNKDLLKKALRALSEIPGEGSFSKKTISEIRYDNKEGFWATLMKDAVRVKMGEDQILLKADRVSQVLDYLDAHRFDARVIDANLTKKVLVRLRKGP
jgi:cell division protein FtsQ